MLAKGLWTGHAIYNALTFLRDLICTPKLHDQSPALCDLGGRDRILLPHTDMCWEHVRTLPESHAQAPVYSPSLPRTLLQEQHLTSQSQSPHTPNPKS